MADDSTLSSANDKTTQWMKNPYDIQYGWCYTDHKDGHELRPKFRNVDYMQDKKYASSVAAMLKKMGLPQPDVSQIYRGTHHDLLFLDNHGVVVRIGPTNVNDLVHPAIIQPLGWIDDKENGITVAIYPGVELIKGTINKDYAKIKLNNVRTGLSRAGHGTIDVGMNNGGVSYVERDGVDVPVAILLDPDSYYNGAASTGEFGDALTRIRESVQRSGAGTNKSDVLGDAISSISELAQDMKGWETFFRTHQPLRTRFWLSQKGREDQDTPDPEYMKMFWDECRSLKQKPKNYIQHKYTSYVNENGITVNRYSSYEIKNASLVSPWTKKESDQKAQRLVPEHKQKMFAEIAVDAAAYEKQHAFYKDSTKFAMQALNINLDCYAHLSEAQQALPEINILRLNRAFFLGHDLGPLVAGLGEVSLQNDEVQRYIMDVFDNYQIEFDDIPASLVDSPAFALKALPQYHYSFKQLIEGKPYAQQRDFVLDAVKIYPDAAENFIELFDDDPDLLWDCVRTNMKFDPMLKYSINARLDEIPDDLRTNVHFANRYIQCFNFDRHGYEVLEHVPPSIVKDKAFMGFILERLKNAPSDAEYLPDVLLDNQKFMLRALRAEPKVFFALKRDMQSNETLARAALYADYKRKAGVCHDVPPQIVDELYEGDDKKFKKYFFELCAVNDVVFSTLPAKYAEDKDFVMNVLDYGANNYFQFSEALRSDRDVAAKAILADLDDNGEHVTAYLPDALLHDSAFIMGVLAENEQSYICFPDFLLDNPQHIPDILREDVDALYALAKATYDGADILTRIFSLDEQVLDDGMKMELSRHLAYQHHWSRDFIPDHFLYDSDHVVELLHIDADIYHALPDDVQATPEVMEAALLNDESYGMDVMKKIPKEILGGLSVWENEDYLEGLTTAIARNAWGYELLPPAVQQDKSFVQTLVEKNSDVYKDLPYEMKAEESIIHAVLRSSQTNVIGVVSVITSALDDAAYNDLDIWFDAGLQEGIQVQLQQNPANFWALPACLQEDKPFLADALAKNIKIFGRFDARLQQDPDVLLSYFDVLGAMPEAQRPNRPVFVPNAYHHDKDFMSDVFARIGFDKAYLPSILADDKAFFDQAVLKSPKLLNDDAFMAHFNAAQYKRSLEDMADPEKWFNNHLVDAFNAELHKALEERAQQYDRVVKREDGLAYEWVANVCPNKVEEQDGRILYNYAGQDNAAPLVYEAAIIGDAANVKSVAAKGCIGIYKLLPE